MGWGVCDPGCVLLPLPPAVVGWVDARLDKGQVALGHPHAAQLVDEAAPVGCACRHPAAAAVGRGGALLATGALGFPRVSHSRVRLERDEQLRKEQGRRWGGREVGATTLPAEAACQLQLLRTYLQHRRVG